MSTIRVNAIQNTNTTDGGIAIDGSGHVSIEGQTLPSAGPLSNRNLIINGAMQVAQRGTSSTSSDLRTVDRFYYNFGNTLAGTQSQQTLSSGTPYNEGFRNFYRFAISTVGSATSTYCQLIQGIEAQNIATSGWQYASADSDVTVSFWVRSSVAQTFYGALKTVDGTAQNYVFSFALSADTWTKVTKTIPGNSNVTINNDNGRGAELVIYPFMGTNYTDSGVNVDAWQAYSGGTRAPDMATNWVLTNGATFDVTGVQLEVGSVATPFEHRSYGDELARCQRYFQVCIRNEEFVTACVTSSSGANTGLAFVNEMRAAPTITLATAGSSAGNVAFLTTGGGTPSTIGSHEALSITTYGFRFKASGYSASGWTSGAATNVYGYSTATVYTASAEL